MTARQLITENIIPLRPTDTGIFALNQMEELQISHLPIVDEAVFVGLISDLEILALPDPGAIILATKPTLARAGVREHQHIFEVLKLFSTLNLTLLPVINDKEQYVGSITLSSLINHLAEMMSTDQPGGIIILDLNDNDYDLVEIASIVESNNAKILNLSVHTFSDSTKIEVILKLNRVDIGPVLQTFFRYNYLVKASWTNEDSYHEGIQDRYDALMNYLSI
ncbi:MAG: CBS domain-containing protein [Bacteroidales bacterium]|nr:CBS domain-containing protein [Bacteroidales bacterium]MDD4602974.1 CBS domain-containing protein [Bacteroidales bacterium]